MIKVVYFDDQSATDYLYIYDGGAKIQTSDKVKEKSGEIANKTSAGIFAKLSWLPFFGGDASTEVDTKLGKKSSSLIRTTLSNTVLTDFLEKISEEGVTHHSAMVYGATVEELKFFAECLNIPTVVIE